MPVEVFVALMPMNCSECDGPGNWECEICEGSQDFSMIEVNFHPNPNDPWAIDRDEPPPF